MFEIVFVDQETGKVNYAITEITQIRYITASEVGFERKGGRTGSSSFPRTEKLEIQRMAESTIVKVHDLKGKGNSNATIANKMGLSESTVRRMAKERLP